MGLWRCFIDMWLLGLVLLLLKVISHGPLRGRWQLSGRRLKKPGYSVRYMTEEDPGGRHIHARKLQWKDDAVESYSAHGL